MERAESSTNDAPRHSDRHYYDTSDDMIERVWHARANFEENQRLPRARLAVLREAHHRGQKV
jgi:hypothetical protein